MMDIHGMRPAAQKATALLKALGNEHRLLILCHLFEGERSVGHLQNLIGIRQSALSQHLARLRHDRLVRTRRESQTIYYSLNGDEARRVIEVLHSMFCAQSKVGDEVDETASSHASYATHEPSFVEN